MRVVVRFFIVLAAGAAAFVAAAPISQRLAQPAPCSDVGSLGRAACPAPTPSLMAMIAAAICFAAIAFILTRRLSSRSRGKIDE